MTRWRLLLRKISVMAKDMDILVLLARSLETSYHYSVATNKCMPFGAASSEHSSTACTMMKASYYYVIMDLKKEKPNFQKKWKDVKFKGKLYDQDNFSNGLKQHWQKGQHIFMWRSILAMQEASIWTWKKCILSDPRKNPGSDASKPS